MIGRRIGVAAFLTFSLAGVSAGQEAVDVSKLPVDLARIERQLRQASVREERDGLNLRYFVDVFGQAPRLELFAPQENLLTGPVPYGAPTHQQMIEMITPQEHRAPAADFGALFRWLADKAKDKGTRR
jgi:hypothetical protein